MSEKVAVHITGKLTGFTNRWNPLKTGIFAKVEVDGQMINIPIDCRQKKFIEKEHPVNSSINLVFIEGKWQIASDVIDADTGFLNDGMSVF